MKFRLLCEASEFLNLLIWAFHCGSSLSTYLPFPHIPRPLQVLVLLTLKPFLVMCYQFFRSVATLLRKLFLFQRLQYLPLVCAPTGPFPSPKPSPTCNCPALCLLSRLSNRGRNPTPCRFVRHSRFGVLSFLCVLAPEFIKEACNQEIARTSTDSEVPGSPLLNTHTFTHWLTVTQYLPIPSSGSLLSLLLESAKGHCQGPGQK